MEKKTPLVSVIVPCYNAEKFLMRCVESVRNQTLSDWELLLIDDCSADGTCALIERLAASDGRIRSFGNRQNQGPGPTRNVGIEAARGKYLLFVDADDAILPDCLKILCDTAYGNQADAVGYGIIRVDDLTGSKELLHWPPQDTPGGWSAARLLEAGNKLGPWLAATLVETEVLRKYDLRFTATVYEDLFLKFRILYHCRHFVNIRDDLYIYYKQTASVSALQTHNKNFSYVLGYMTMLDYVREWLERVKRTESVPQTEEQAVYNYFLIFSAYWMNELRANIGDEFDRLFDEYAAKEFGSKAVYIKTLTELYRSQVETIRQLSRKKEEQSALVEFYEAAEPEFRSFHRRQEIANLILSLSRSEWEKIADCSWYGEFWTLATRRENLPNVRAKAREFGQQMRALAAGGALAAGASDKFTRQKAALALVLYDDLAGAIEFSEPDDWPEKLGEDFLLCYRYLELTKR